MSSQLKAASRGPSSTERKRDLVSQAPYAANVINTLSSSVEPKWDYPGQEHLAYGHLPPPTGESYHDKGKSQNSSWIRKLRAFHLAEGLTMRQGDTTSSRASDGSEAEAREDTDRTPDYQLIQRVGSPTSILEDDGRSDARDYHHRQEEPMLRTLRPLQPLVNGYGQGNGNGKHSKGKGTNSTTSLRVAIDGIAKGQTETKTKTKTKTSNGEGYGTLGMLTQTRELKSYQIEASGITFQVECDCTGLDAWLRSRSEFADPTQCGPAYPPRSDASDKISEDIPRTDSDYALREYRHTPSREIAVTIQEDTLDIDPEEKPENVWIGKAHMRLAKRPRAERRTRFILQQTEESADGHGPALHDVFVIEPGSADSTATIINTA